MERGWRSRLAANTINCLVKQGLGKVLKGSSLAGCT